jgi:hypothetical protein
MEKSVTEHDEIIAALDRSEGNVAGDLMRTHVNMLGEEAGDFIAVLSGIEKTGISGGLALSTEPAKADDAGPDLRRKENVTT